MVFPEPSIKEIPTEVLEQYIIPVAVFNEELSDNLKQKIFQNEWLLLSGHIVREVKQVTRGNVVENIKGETLGLRLRFFLSEEVIRLELTREEVWELRAALVPHISDLSVHDLRSREQVLLRRYVLMNKNENGVIEIDLKKHSYFRQLLKAKNKPGKLAHLFTAHPTEINIAALNEVPDRVLLGVHGLGEGSIEKIREFIRQLLSS